MLIICESNPDVISIPIHVGNSNRYRILRFGFLYHGTRSCCTSRVSTGSAALAVAVPCAGAILRTSTSCSWCFFTGRTTTKSRRGEVSNHGASQCRGEGEGEVPQARGHGHPVSLISIPGYRPPASTHTPPLAVQVVVHAPSASFVLATVRMAVSPRYSRSTPGRWLGYWGARGRSTCGIA